MEIFYLWRLVANAEQWRRYRKKLRANSDNELITVKMATKEVEVRKATLHSMFMLKHRFTVFTRLTAMRTFTAWRSVWQGEREHSRAHKLFNYVASRCNDALLQKALCTWIGGVRGNEVVRLRHKGLEARASLFHQTGDSRNPVLHRYWTMWHFQAAACRNARIQKQQHCKALGAHEVRCQARLRDQHIRMAEQRELIIQTAEAEIHRIRCESGKISAPVKSAEENACASQKRRAKVETGDPFACATSICENLVPSPRIPSEAAPVAPRQAVDPGGMTSGRHTGRATRALTLGHTDPAIQAGRASCPRPGSDQEALTQLGGAPCLSAGAPGAPARSNGAGEKAPSGTTKPEMRWDRALNGAEFTRDIRVSPSVRAIPRMREPERGRVSSALVGTEMKDVRSVSPVSPISRLRAEPARGLGSSGVFCADVARDVRSVSPTMSPIPHKRAERETGLGSSAVFGAEVARDVRSVSPPTLSPIPRLRPEPEKGLGSSAVFGAEVTRDVRSVSPMMSPIPHMCAEPARGLGSSGVFGAEVARDVRSVSPMMSPIPRLRAEPEKGLGSSAVFGAEVPRDVRSVSPPTMSPIPHMRAEPARGLGTAAALGADVMPGHTSGFHRRHVSYHTLATSMGEDLSSSAVFGAEVTTNCRSLSPSHHGRLQKGAATRRCISPLCPDMHPEGLNVEPSKENSAQCADSVYAASGMPHEICFPLSSRANKLARFASVDALSSGACMESPGAKDSFGTRGQASLSVDMGALTYSGKTLSGTFNDLHASPVGSVLDVTYEDLLPPPTITTTYGGVDLLPPPALGNKFFPRIR